MILTATGLRVVQLEDDLTLTFEQIERVDFDLSEIFVVTGPGKPAVKIALTSRSEHRRFEQAFERLRQGRTVEDNMVTTLPTLPGYRIVKVHGVITELAAHAGFTAQSKGYIALDWALGRLRAAASKVGANAIVGVSGSSFAAGGGITNVFGGDAVGIFLLGTAVTVEPERPSQA